jgi:hypothetical protein
MLTAARFERLGHLYALRDGDAIECVMTATDKSNAIALKEAPRGMPHNSCKDMCHLDCGNQFDSNNPRSILKDDCVAGCHCSGRTNSAQIVLDSRI